MNINELWQKLDLIGVEEVRIKKAEGVFGEKKLALVNEWIYRQESKNGLKVPRDPEREHLYTKLKSMNQKEFAQEIKLEKDDGRLGYLRYDFSWDPDPRKSTWQAIEINRLLTRRKEVRTLKPAWIGIAITALLSIVSLVVSIIGLINNI